MHDIYHPLATTGNPADLMLLDRASGRSKLVSRFVQTGEDHEVGEHRESVRQLELVGIPEIDRGQGALLRDTVNLLRAPDQLSQIYFIGAFLNRSLASGERALLVTFDNVDLTMNYFSRLGFDLGPYLANEQLVYFYYRPNFTRCALLSDNYLAMFQELMRLANGGVRRAAFLYGNVLFNTQSKLLAEESTQNVLIAANKLGATTLVSYTSQDPADCHLIDGVCRNGHLSCLRLDSPSAQHPGRYPLTWNRSWLWRVEKTRWLSLEAADESADLAHDWYRSA